VGDEDNQTRETIRARSSGEVLGNGKKKKRKIH
jgi:hypothetical protein